MRAISLAVIVFALVACQRADERPTSAPALPLAIANPYPKLGIPMHDGVPDLSTVTITMSRSMCFGMCPDYEVSLNGSGLGRYVGRMFVVQEGAVEFTFRPNEMLPILEMLDVIDFMNVRHTCTYHEPDSSMTTLTLAVGDRSASCRSPVGSGTAFQMPVLEAAYHARFGGAEDAVDRVSGSAKWVGTYEQLQAKLEFERDTRVK